MKDRNLFFRVELTGKDQHNLTVSSIDSKVYYNRDRNLTYEELKQHIETELDSWFQEVRDEEGNSRGD